MCVMSCHGGMGECGLVGCGGGGSKLRTEKACRALTRKGTCAPLCQAGVSLSTPELVCSMVRGCEGGRVWVRWSWRQSVAFLWMARGGMPLSASRETIGEDFMAPVDILIAAFCSGSSLWRMVLAAEL